VVQYPVRTFLVIGSTPEVRSFVYEDRTITCADCGQEFTFTASEQAFYAEKGFTDPPKRCKPCRQARKAQRNAGSESAGGDSYGSGGGDSYGGNSGGYGGNSGGGGGGYGGGGGGSYICGCGVGNDRPPRQMYDAVCADCGKTAQVPFQPTGSRPVYCNDCFRSHR
jgi:CxxC-x17-CxxC domain-containing protein